MAAVLAGDHFPRRSRFDRSRRRHPILNPQVPMETTAPAAPARQRATRRKPRVVSAGGCSAIAPMLIGRGGLATAEELVCEVFGVTRGDAAFKKKRRIVYKWQPGRSTFGPLLWDRAALGHAFLATPDALSHEATATSDTAEEA